MLSPRGVAGRDGKKKTGNVDGGTINAAIGQFVSDTLAFYTIPKVKFALWFASHVIYTFQLTELGIIFSEDREVSGA